MSGSHQDNGVVARQLEPAQVPQAQYSVARRIDIQPRNMTVLSPGDLPTQTVSSATTLWVPMMGHHKANSSTTNVSLLVPEAEKDTDKGYNSDPGFFSALLRKARLLGRSKTKKSSSPMTAGSPLNIPTPTINLVITNADGTPSAPVVLTPERHQRASNGPALQRGGLGLIVATAQVPPATPTVTHIPHNIFLVDAPAPIIRLDTPANHRARFESTLQLAFCAGLLPKNTPSLAFESGATDVPVLDETGQAWLTAMQDDPSAQSHIRWLISKLVAEFVKDASMGSAAISEVVILGPALCRKDYRSLLSCLIERFDLTVLLNIDLLQGVVQLVQSASPGYLADDDLVRILASLRGRLDSTHALSKAYVYQLVLAVSKVLEVMVIGEVKGLNRQRDHQSLLAVLRGLREVEDDPFLKFQVSYAFQTLLYLPDDETSWQAFLRHAQSVAVGVTAVACVFKLDPMNALAAVEHLQQVASNAIDVIKSNIDGAHAFQATAQGASQAAERIYWSNKKEAWFLTLQVAHVFVREGRLVEFNTLVCNAPCRTDDNFQRGICLILGEIAANQLWDVASRRSAIDFLGELYKVETGRKKGVKIRKWIASMVSQISKMSWPDVSVHASALLTSLKENQFTDTENCHPLHTYLPLPTSFPLLDRILDIPNVEYDLECLKFQRLEEGLFPISIPLRAKSSLLHSDNSSFLLMEKVRDFLESDRRVFLLLGDSGSGKSMFCRQLERELWNDYEVGYRIPLYINLPSIDQPDNDLIGKHLCDYNNILAHRVQEIKRHRQLVLICDGYDESRLTANLYTANRLGQIQIKMIVSCRNTFLSHGYEGRFRPYGADKFHDNSSDLFEEATIVSFTESDIQEFITQFVKDPTAAAFLGNVSVSSQDDYLEKLSVIPNLMDLAKNPFLLTLALKALPSLSASALGFSKLEATQQDLYRGFINEWIRLSKERLDRGRLSHEVREVFDELLEADFWWCVRDYSKRLARAIFLQQKGHPVVEYTHLKDKQSWKAEFFGRDLEPTLLREASPLTRAGKRHWFIHKSLLDYFLSLAVFDPDDIGDGDSDDCGGDDYGHGGGNNYGGGGSASYDGGSDGLHDDGGNPAHGFGSSSGGNGGSSEGSGSSSGGGGSSSSGSGNSSGGGSNTSGGNNDSHGGSSRSPNKSGDSGAGKDGSNGDGDDSRRRKDDARSKRKARMDRSRASTSSDLISELNLFKEPAVMLFLVERARTDLRFQNLLVMVIEQSKSSVHPSLAAANAITILFKSGKRFQHVDLDGVLVPRDYMSEETSGFVSLASGSLTGNELTDALMAPQTSASTSKEAVHSETIPITSPKPS
ncbi:hypothetical protein BGW39_005466, partial [Mortierella sp. 14UC]